MDTFLSIMVLTLLILFMAGYILGLNERIKKIEIEIEKMKKHLANNIYSK